MPRSVCREFTRLLAALGCAAGILAGLATPALAEDQDPTKLSLKPVGTSGSYFDLTMEPGQSRSLQAELGNHGQAPVTARTYAADAYTIYNGGFGAKDRDSAPGRTTSWLSYANGVVQLPAGQASIRDLAVTVPPGTAPGEYLTSIVLENETPVQGTGSVALNQIVRQVVAVSIRVPGALQPALGIGTASHKFTADQSVVGIGVSNTGSANLKPAGDLIIRDRNGKTVSQAPIAMGAFYANTDSQVETTLGGKLQPGDYTASITLTDPATNVSATGKDLPFTVEAAAAMANKTAGPGQLPQIMQDTAAGPGPWIGAAATAAAALAAAAFLMRRRTGNRAGRKTTTSTGPSNDQQR